MYLVLFIVLQKDSDPSKRDALVFLLQDMLEVVTRDIMVNEIRLVKFVLLYIEENVLFLVE